MPADPIQPPPKYWLVLFNHQSFEAFLHSGASIIGFRERRWRTVQQFKSGDYLLCYLTGASRWIGALTVADKPYRSKTRLWPTAPEYNILTARVAVKPVVLLTPETAVPIKELTQLSLFQDGSLYWTARLRQSPALWSESDGEVVMESLLDAEVNPAVRELDRSKLKRPLRSLNLAFVTGQNPPVKLDGFHEPGSHTEIQWLLLHLGSAMGLHVWVARNDRGRQYAGQRFADLNGMLSELPRQFDLASMKIIELIDVLWLQEQAIVAAFEIESTSTIYSGLLRMADLIALQPNLHIPLYIVAPDERRRKVMREIKRPVFQRQKPPLSHICRYIAFSRLRLRYQEITSLLPHVNPSILDHIAEVCE